MRRAQSFYALLPRLDAINSTLKGDYWNHWRDELSGECSRWYNSLGHTKEVHDQRLHEVLAKIEESGLKLKRKKCQFSSPK